MSARDFVPAQTEPTPEGEQMLVPGGQPITARDRLALLMAAPMRPRATNSTCFDEECLS